MKKISSQDAYILLLPAYFLFSKMLCVEKMWFWWEIYQTLKKRKRAHIVFSIIRPFLYCLQQKRILSYYVLIALNIWWMLPLNKMKLSSNILSNCIIFLTFVWYSMSQNNCCNFWWSVRFFAITEKSCQSSFLKNIESMKIRCHYV